MSITTKPTSPISIGCDSIPFKKGYNADDILDAAFVKGVTTLDTARGYGESEAVIGEWINRNENREKIYLISKGCLPRPFSRLNTRCLRKDLEKSLLTLATSYIDLYLLHRDDKKADLHSIFADLDQYRREGKILAYGVSNWSVERIREANRICEEKGYAKIAAVSNNVSLLPWERDPWGGGDGCKSFTGDEASLIACKEMGIPVYAYSPLARGFLTGRVNPDDITTLINVDFASKRAYLSERNLAKLRDLLQISASLGVSLATLTISYLTHLETRVVPVLGISKPSRIESNLKAANLELDQNTMEAVKEIVNR